MSGWWLASYLVLWLVVAVLAVLVVALARQVGTLHLRLGPRGALEVDEEGPLLGEAPPASEARGEDEERFTLGGPERPRLVLFVSPTCPICKEVLPAIPAVAQASRLAPQVVSDPDVERAWNVPGTPFAVVLDELGVVVAKGTVNNLEQVEGLVETAERRMDELDREAG